MMVKIIECPRDAMQGIHAFIPTAVKISYLNKLLKVGFHTLDCGSFVSPRAIPQMKDTEEVLDALDLSDTRTQLSVIVANERGIAQAATHEKVTYLGFPFSISEVFQRRNTNKGIEASVGTVEYMMEQCHKAGKQAVVYISMGFGNPYKEDWSPEKVVEWTGRLGELGVTSFSISDTVGVSKPDTIGAVYSALNRQLPQYEYGAHFHTRSDNWMEKVETAWNNGCRRFDGAIKGYGGCPMAADKLVGNMPTENLLYFFNEKDIETGTDPVVFQQAMAEAVTVFGS